MMNTHSNAESPTPRRDVILGQGNQFSHPYEVAIHWERLSSHPPHIIALSEGSGHASMGGYFSLGDLVKPEWTLHLELCDCLWLRDLAREEQELGRFFSADEIFARWHKRASSTK